MGLFEDISNAEEQGRGQKITEPELGESLSYVVKILKHALFQSKRKLGDVFVAEFEVVEESGKDQIPGGTKARKGGRYSWAQFPSGQWGDMAKGNIKTYIRALLGKDEDPTSQDIRDVIENRHTDICLHLNVEHIITEKAQRDYFVHTWSPVAQDQVSESVVEELTKEQWLEGEGPGTTHPVRSEYEYHQQHPDWGVRLAK